MRLHSSILHLAVLFLVARSATAEEPPLKQARAFLEEHRLSAAALLVPENFAAIHKRISASRDPESKFHPFIFNIVRRGEPYISAEQKEAINQLIEARQNSPVNWHDVRNIVRVQAQIAMWSLATASSNAEASKYRSEWEEWTDLRLAYMFQEFVALDRFQRSIWNVYTSEQRKKIVTGEWDHLVKKNLGHGRLYSADKQVTRALGKPDDAAAFIVASDHWRTQWETVLDSYQKAARFQRQLEFSMSETDERFSIACWKDYENTFRNFAVAECDAVREIAQAGYQPDGELKKTCAAYQDKLRRDMIKRYQVNAIDFLRLLGEIK